MTSTKSTARRSFPFALAAFALALPSFGCIAMDGSIDDLDAEEGVTETEDALYPLSSTLWSQKAIAVCWENGSATTATEQGWVKAAVDSQWPAVSGVSFMGWGNCTATSSGIRIKIDDSGPHVKALGKDLDGYVDGMVLNFTFNNWSPVCKNSKQDCIEDIAVHEFGHALGIAHEHNRADRPGSCTEPAQGTNGDWAIGPWDLDSVMNYCNPDWNGDGTLSARDMVGIQEMYGLLKNPDGSRGDMNGWSIVANGGNGWIASGGVFVTSYALAKRTQTIDLLSRGFSAADLAAAPPIEVSEQFRRTYCPDKYFLTVELLDASMNVVKKFDTGTVTQTGPCDYNGAWETVSHVFTGYGPNVRYVRWTDGGQDGEFWAGNYGVAMNNATLKVRKNMLANPDASAGNMSGWTVTQNGGNGWAVSGGAFITSYGWDRRTQTVDLFAQGFSASSLASLPPIHVSEQFRRTWCADYYSLKVELLDANQQVLTTFDTGDVQQASGACDYNGTWDTVSKTFTGYPAGVRYVRFTDGGRDSEFWAGSFGVALDNAVVTVLR